MVRTCALAAAGALLLACAGVGRPSTPPSGTDEAAARDVLMRFARALEAGRVDEAHALLSARWRVAYTPGRLALDYRAAGAAARDATGRVIAALDAQEPLERTLSAARLPLAGRRAALLVAEEGRWRVDALE